jgi:hypothetical protein
MKTNVAMSGVGETRIQAAFSYDNCAMKRKAMCSCLSKLGSQSLQMACLCPNNPGRRKNLKEFHQRGNLEEGKGSIDACDEKKKKKENGFSPMTLLDSDSAEEGRRGSAMKEVRASACSVSALSAASRQLDPGFCLSGEGLNIESPGSETDGMDQTSLDVLYKGCFTRGIWLDEMKIHIIRCSPVKTGHFHIHIGGLAHESAIRFCFDSPG